MSGFTIYETLRIFVPGALAMLILDVTLRLSTGASVTDVGSGDPAVIVDAIETTATFLLLALFAGLLLYLLDFPERLRIVDGDPTRDVPRPSLVMKDILKNYNADPRTTNKYDERSYLSLFFLFSDKDIPEALQKRIYLFGAMFKIFVDARLLLVAALVIGVPASIAGAANRHATSPTLSADPAAVTLILITALSIGLLGAIGQITFSHAQRRHVNNTQKALPQGTTAREVVRPVLVLAALMGITVLMAVRLDDTLRYLAIVPAAATLIAWFAVEVGPPASDRPEKWSPLQHGLRDEFLRRLHIQQRDAPQLPIWFRTLTDLAVIVPTLVGASIAAVYLEREPTAILPWAALAVLSVLIMSIRKHEIRLIGAYHHQLAYLALSEARIQSALAKREGL